MPEACINLGEQISPLPNSNGCGQNFSLHFGTTAGRNGGETRTCCLSALSASRNSDVLLVCSLSESVSVSEPFSCSDSRSPSLSGSGLLSFALRLRLAPVTAILAVGHGSESGRSVYQVRVPAEQAVAAVEGCSRAQRNKKAPARLGAPIRVATVGNTELANWSTAANSRPLVNMEPAVEPRRLANLATAHHGPATAHPSPPRHCT